MERIKIAQLGIGHNHGEEKMKAFRKFPEICDVVGVCEPDPVWLERRKDLPGYAGLPFMTQEELFAISGLQAVSVETDVKDLDAARWRASSAAIISTWISPAGKASASLSS